MKGFTGIKQRICRKSFWLVFFAFSATVLSDIVCAESFSRTKDQNYSLKDIIEEPLKYDKVMIKGIVLRQLDADSYLVQDGTAVMEVTIPGSLMPGGRLAPRNHISFEGDVDIDWKRSIEIDVDSLTFSF